MSNLIVALILMSCGLFASDLAKIAGNSNQARDQKDLEARKFLAELTRKDPCYYPGRNDLKLFSCRVINSLIEDIRNTYNESSSYYSQQLQDWGMDYFWQSPDLFYISHESWMDFLRKRTYNSSFNSLLELSVDLARIFELAPFPFDKYFLEYSYNPENIYPHHLRAFPKESNARNFIVNLLYDKEYVLREIQEKVFLSEYHFTNFQYQKTPKGLTLTEYWVQGKGNDRVITVHFNYKTIMGIMVPCQILFDIPTIPDTEFRKKMPVKIDLTNIQVNQPIPENIKIILKHELF